MARRVGLTEPRAVMSHVRSITGATGWRSPPPQDSEEHTNGDEQAGEASGSAKAEKTVGGEHTTESRL